MKKSQYIAVFVGIAVIAFLLYGNSIMNLFGVNNGSQAATTQDLPTTGVKVTDETVGTGAVAKKGDKLTVHYVGTLPNGQVFDSSVDRGTPFTFVLGEGKVIRGWDEGLVGMKVGGKRELIIAPDYGYGSQAVGSIPANSTLIFQVQLLDVQPSSSTQ